MENLPCRTTLLLLAEEVVLAVVVTPGSFWEEQVHVRVPGKQMSGFSGA